MFRNLSFLGDHFFLSMMTNISRKSTFSRDLVSQEVPFPSKSTISRSEISWEVNFAYEYCILGRHPSPRSASHAPSSDSYHEAVLADEGVKVASQQKSDIRLNNPPASNADRDNQIT